MTSAKNNHCFYWVNLFMVSWSYETYECSSSMKTLLWHGYIITLRERTEHLAKNEFPRSHKTEYSENKSNISENKLSVRVKINSNEYFPKKRKHLFFSILSRKITTNRFGGVFTTVKWNEIRARPSWKCLLLSNQANCANYWPCFANYRTSTIRREVVYLDSSAARLLAP